MARHPEPWPWEARKGWYATVAGTRHRLASFAEGKRVAARRLAALLAEAGRPAAEVPTVGELIGRYLLDLARRREAGEIERQTKDDAVRRLAGFAEMHGAIPADQLRPLHVTEWLATKETWGP